MCSPCDQCETCDECQVLCENTQQARDYGSYPCQYIEMSFEKDQIIIVRFPRVAFQQIFDWLGQAVEAGAEKSTGSASHHQVDPFFVTAADWNALGQDISKFGSYLQTVQKNDLITHDLFNIMRTTLQGLQIAEDACDANNACGSDCQICDTCMGCVGCDIDYCSYD